MSACAKGSSRPAARRHRPRPEAVAMQAKPPSWLVASRRFPPPALPFVRVAEATEPPVHSPASYREHGQAEERQQLDHGFDPGSRGVRQRPQPCAVEPETVALYPIRLPKQRATQTLFRHRPGQFVSPQQPKMQPLRRPWTCGIERSVSYLPVLVDAQIRHRGGERPGKRMAARLTHSCNELLDRYLPLQHARAIPALGERQLPQETLHPATPRPTPRPDRDRPMKEPPRAHPRRSSAVGGRERAPSPRWPQAKR